MKEIGPVKILVVGDAQVGKTSFSEHFNPKKMDNLALRGSGADCLNYIEYKYPARNFLAKIQLMELTAGFPTIRMQNLLFHGALGVIMICDNTNPSTIEPLPQWISRIITELGKEVPISILINKCDQKPDCGEREKEIEEKLVKLGYAKNHYKIVQISVYEQLNLEEGVRFILNSYDFEENLTKSQKISIPLRLWNRIEKEAKKRNEDPKEFLIQLVERNLGN